MLRGFSTVSYWADDLEAAKQWYSELLGIEPYFEARAGEKVAYYEFRVGEYQHELGLIDSSFRPEGTASGPGGVVLFWHVDDVEAALEQLIAMGATPHDGPIERGEGFVTASVIDPFGNILGVMYSPHFLAVLESKSDASAASEIN